MHHVERRHFLKTSLAVTSGALLGTAAEGWGQDAGKKQPAGSRKLITRTLGRTGLVLPIVSMGVMRADNPGLVRSALEQGMIHLDTAHGYQRGRNEEMLGKVLAGYPRSSFVIATKVKPESGDAPEATRAWLSNLDLSLRRLTMDYVDILYLHAIGSREEALAPAMLEALRQAKESGRARFVGLSTHEREPEVIDAAVECGVYDVVLTAVNFKQDHYPSVKAAIARAAAAGVGIVGMKTMAGGYYDKAKTRRVNCKAALKFVLQDEHVTTTIPGITSFDQLAENASVNSDLVLTEEERDALAAGNLEGGLYCQGCRQCVETCDRGIHIPAYMRAFMYTYGYRDLSLAHTLLSQVDTDANPCADCASCSVRCAKDFPVRERIADVRRVRMIPEDLLA